MKERLKLLFEKDLTQKWHAELFRSENSIIPSLLKEESANNSVADFFHKAVDIHSVGIIL